MTLFLYFIFGACVGSFLHVVGYRLPTGSYFSSARSKCTHCEHTLRGYELIPLISYLFLRGKCSKCHMGISFMYPASEIVCGSLFVLSYMRFGYSLNLAFALLFVSLLFVLAVCDIYYYILPNILVFLLFILIFIWTLTTEHISFSASLTSVLFSLLLLGLLIYFTKGGMGLGDFKLLAVLAYFFGLQTYLHLLFLSSLLAIIYYIFTIYISKKSSYLFFGPFIALAACLLLFIQN